MCWGRVVGEEIRVVTGQGCVALWITERPLVCVHGMIGGLRRALNRGHIITSKF